MHKHPQLRVRHRRGDAGDPAGAEFDYVISAEDMRMGARFANYSIEYQAISWQTLVARGRSPGRANAGRLVGA